MTAISGPCGFPEQHTPNQSTCVSSLVGPWVGFWPSLLTVPNAESPKYQPLHRGGRPLQTPGVFIPPQLLGRAPSLGAQGNG